MPFQKTTWRNGGEPAITAEQLNRIEKGIEDAYNGEGIDSTLIAQKLGYTPANSQAVSENAQDISNLERTVDTINITSVRVNRDGDLELVLTT